MKILYNATDGKIFYAVYDRDLFAFSHTTNIPLTEMTIDEIDPVNKPLCLDLYRTQNKTDAEGENRFRVDGAGQLTEKADWKEEAVNVL